MSLINFSNIQDATTIDAADVNSPMNTIYNDYNGNITDANISATAAITGTKIGGAWKSWTPSVIGATVNNGAVYGRYSQVGKSIHFKIKFLVGAGTTFNGLPFQFSLPTSSTDTNGILPTILAKALDDGVSWHTGTAFISGGYVNEITDSVTHMAWASTLPFVWANNDYIQVSGTYEAA